ncbi:MAG: hypothetical protein V4722_08000 [Bacteroidota bacterium]
MKRFLLLLHGSILLFTAARAQTWNGSVSNNWNTPGNWTGGLPTGASNVTIPGALAVYPVLNSNVTINGITMNSGSRLDVNGFTLGLNSVNFFNNITGAILNNSNGATDIVLNINTGGGGYTTIFNSNTVNDAIIFNLTGTNQLFEGNAAPANQYNGSVTFNIGGSMPVSIASGAASVFGGNLTVSRTVGGVTSLFAVGGTISGNYSFTNNSGGAIGMGNTTTKTNITGTINIACNYPAPATFDMYNITNQTTGGTINIQNPQGVFLQKDTLKVSSLSVTGYRGNTYAYIQNNSITGNSTFADDASYNTGYASYYRSNLFTGTTSISVNGPNAVYEAASAAGEGNRYIGSTTFTINSTAPVYISHTDTSQFDGNLTINRTAAGHTQAFNSSGIVNGNFAYTNNTAGNTYFGNPANRTPISGTINIAANYSAVNFFEMYRLINQTTGGSINVQNSQGFNVQRDTLKVSSFSITGYTGNAYGYLIDNHITGNVTITSGATYSGGYISYIRSNRIIGNGTFTNNSTNSFYEAELAGSGNYYTGNTVFNAAGSGTFVVSHLDTSRFDGNLSFTRTVAGITYIFNNGGIVNGNFAYTNNTAGHTYLGNVATKTAISGTVNIAANYSTPEYFEMYRLVNLTTGGSINVQNSAGFNIQRDTLKLTSLSLTGYRGNQYAYLLNNDITANVTTADDASYSGGYSTHLRNNVITGNSSFSNNGTNVFYEADGVGNGNKYVGNVTFNGAGGPLYLAHASPMQCTGNVTVNRMVAGTTYVFYGGNSTVTGNFSYTNNTSGITYFGSTAAKTSIGGTINIAASYATPATFDMYRLVNQTGGGSVKVLNSSGFSVQNDTLIVDSLKLTGYRGNNFAYLYENHITGHLVTADDATYSGGYSTTFRKNTITGNTNISCNGTNVLNDVDGGSDGSKYLGNVTYTRTAGTLNVAGADTIEIGGNLTLNSTAGLNLGKLRFSLGSNGAIEQLGTQPINIPLLIMAKTGTGKITLNDSVAITGVASFTSGNIYSSAGKNLIFEDGTTHNSSSATSHVVGPVAKIGDDAFTFPVGSPNSLNIVGISAPVGVTSKFRAEYKNQNPSIDGYNTASKVGSLSANAISKAGYWDVQRLSGVTNVTLTLGFGTNPYETYPTPLTGLKVVHWGGTQWEDHGNAAPTGTAASGTINNSVAITSFSPFTLAGVIPTYFYNYSTPGSGPDGTPVKFGLIGGYLPDSIKQLPGGSYTADSIFLIANGSSVGFKGKDFYNVEKDDTTVTVPAAPVTYISANGNGTVNFTGWRHFVYMRNGSNQIMGAIKDSGLTLGNTTMNTYFSTANVATSPNGNIYLKRSFKITSQFAPAGAKRVVRFYITKTEFNDLVAADPTAFPSGINSLTITKYTGPMEDSLFNPQPGGNAVIIPNSAITIVDMGTLYSLDIAVDGFSGFYIGGNNMNLNLCSGSTITLPSNISGATYQWQVDNGGGFANISNGGIYSGATSSALTIINPPNTIYGYKYRALVNGVTPSQVYTIKLNISWTGAVSTAWENVANWSCGALPNDNTDVVINAGKPNFPQLNSNVSIRSLRVNPGATVTIKAGFNLTVKK